MHPSMMVFPQYARLPAELRLQIIEEAVNTCIELGEASGRKAGIAPLASVDSDRNQVVERILFKSIKFHGAHLQNFASICGKRHGLLRQLTFQFGPHYLSCLRSISAEPHGEIADHVSQLFHVMKDWSPAETPSRLIKLTISIANPVAEHSWAVTRRRSSSDSCNFTRLPVVAAIGRIYVRVNAPGRFYWSHATVHAFHRKLPNLRSARLAMPTNGNLREIVDETSSRMLRSHVANRNLTKLSICLSDTLNPLPTQNRGNQIIMAQSLTPRLSLWRNTLVCLKLDCYIDPPQFLLTASTSLWPNLDRLEFVGTLDDDDNAADRTWYDEVRACNDLIQGITACLPNMPKLTTLSIRFSEGGWACNLCMDLDTTKSPEKLVLQRTSKYSDHRPKKCPVRPCCPLTTESGTIIIRDFTLPSHLMKELQDSVRLYRHVDLTVFRCTEFESSIFEERGPHPPCGRWSNETNSWETAFMNDMDEFIFHMGQYWQRLEVWDS